MGDILCIWWQGLKEMETHNTEGDGMLKEALIIFFWRKLGTCTSCGGKGDWSRELIVHADCSKRLKGNKWAWAGDTLILAIGGLWEKEVDAGEDGWL